MLIFRGENKHVKQMLNTALIRERNQWKSCKYDKCRFTEQTIEVSGEQRDMIIKWLSELNDFLTYAPETLFLTVSLLDTFLNSVKAHPKYLYCIAVSCFYVAIKVTEEDEVIPTTQELIDISHCGCSIAELLRMERVILKKIDWNLRRVTSLDFLHIFHGLLTLNCPGLLDMKHVGSGGLLVFLGVKLKASLPYHKLATFRPSTVSLSLISLELEFSTPNWFALTIALQKLAEISNTDFIHCREELSVTMLSLYGKVQFFNCYANESTYCSVKHKMEQTDVEEIYDSIKCLYGEDGATSCSSAAVSDGFSSVTDHQLPSVPAV